MASTSGSTVWLTELQGLLSEAVDVMRIFKRGLDPQDIMNPGKIFRP